MIVFNQPVAIITISTVNGEKIDACGDTYKLCHLLGLIRDAGIRSVASWSGAPCLNYGEWLAPCKKMRWYSCQFNQILMTKSGLP